jgi:hypothetical protein
MEPSSQQPTANSQGLMGWDVALQADYVSIFTCQRRQSPDKLRQGPRFAEILGFAYAYRIYI